MNPVNAILLGVLAALALQRKNSGEGAVTSRTAWQLVAAVVGAMFPYTEAFLVFVGPGAMAQGMGGLTWSLVLMPVYAVGLAGLLGVMAQKPWDEMLPPVCGGLAAAWFLAILTEPGIFPLALLFDWRVGLAVLNRFDVVLMVLCMVGIGMCRAFKIYDRDLARLTLLCVMGYVGLVAFWGWQAREFGHRYAQLLEVNHARVEVEPQALSPLNWRVMVVEANGRIHSSMITLGRGGAGTRGEVSDDPYRTRSEAVWRIERRYGGMDVSEDMQRRVRLAWYGWQNTAFAWLGRYAIFDRMYAPQEVGMAAYKASGTDVQCVGFRDFRAVTPDEIAKGTYVICPWRDERVRVFRPRGEMDAKGQWPGMMELVAFSELRT